MGVEPKDEDIPQDPSTFLLKLNRLSLLLNALPDIWEGMNGIWIGKNYNGYLIFWKFMK